MTDPPPLLGELADYEEALTLIYNAAHYVGEVAYSEGEEFLFKNAFVFELQERFRRWSLHTGKRAPQIQTEYVVACPFPLSLPSVTEIEIPPTIASPTCTHLRIDVYIYGSADFPSTVIELKAVDKMTASHCKQAHEYFAILQQQQRALKEWIPQLAMVINFRSHFVKDECHHPRTKKRKKGDDDEEDGGQEEDTSLFAITHVNLVVPFPSSAAVLQPKARGPYPSDPPIQIAAGNPTARGMRWLRLTH